jgi:hypothetical protein
MQSARQAPPTFPKRLAYLWIDFCDIIGGMDSNGWSPSVVTWEGLRAWSEMTGTQLDPWEAKLLVRLGALRARVLSEQSPTDGAGGKPQ